MKLPDEVQVSEAAARAIADRSGLSDARLARIQSSGMINTVYTLGDDYVLRVPRAHPAHEQQAVREAEVIPHAVGAGVRTPGLVLFDEARDILPVPYLVVERVEGVNLETSGSDPVAADVWREVGRDLARLHAGTVPDDLRPMDIAKMDDPRTLAERRVAEGWLSDLDARWLEAWLDRLDAAIDRPVPNRLVHGDVQMANVLVDAESSRYVAVIDWGCARSDDCVADALAMPLEASRHLLAGHRDVAPLDADETAEARILWRLLQVFLAVLPRGAAPGLSWAERPVAWLMDLARFFLGDIDDAWRAVGPPSGRSGTARSR